MQHPLQPPVRAAAAVTRAGRLPRWRKWLALFALTCAVALYSIEATHDHRSAVDQLRCPVCHVAGHNALDSTTPDLAPVAPLAILFLVLLPALVAGLSRRPFFPKPQTRAPPALAL
jgi:hypothetical protein